MLNSQTWFWWCSSSARLRVQWLANGLVHLKQCVGWCFGYCGVVFDVVQTLVLAFELSCCVATCLVSLTRVVPSKLRCLGFEFLFGAKLKQLLCNQCYTSTDNVWCVSFTERFRGDEARTAHLV